MVKRKQKLNSSNKVKGWTTKRAWHNWASQCINRACHNQRGEEEKKERGEAEKKEREAYSLEE